MRPRAVTAVVALLVWGSVAAPAGAVPAAAPGPVTDVYAAVVGNGQSVALTWKNPGPADFRGVMVRRAKGVTAPASATAGTLVADLGPTRTTYTDAGLAPLTTYSYALFAHDTTPLYAAGATARLATVFAPALEGRVTRADTGAPVRGVTVTATPTSPGLTLTAASDVTGRYIVVGAQATVRYTLCLQPSTAVGAPPAGWAPDCGRLQPVARAGSVVNGLDSALGPGVGIRGTVVSASDELPVAGAVVSVFSSGHPVTLPQPVRSTAAGGFSVAGLPPTTTGYQICLDGTAGQSGSSTAGFFSGCYGGGAWAGGTSPPPTSGVTTVSGHAGAISRPVVVLRAADRIHGSLVETLSGDPLVGTTVDVLAAGVVVSDATTVADDGTYSVLLPDGDYQICFDTSTARWDSQDVRAPAGFTDSCVGNAYWPGGVPSGATTFHLLGGATVAAGSQAVAAAAGFLGTFAPTDQGVTQPIVGAVVHAFDTSGADIASTTSGADGSWEMDRLQPGTYFVCADFRTATIGGDAVAVPGACLTSGDFVFWFPPTAPTAGAEPTVGVGSGTTVELDIS